MSISDVNNSITGAWGSAYVNQFVDRGRIKRVFIQGDPSSRMSPQDLDQWYVRNASGGMVPFSAFISPSWTYGSPKLERYNGLPSFEILGQPAPGRSTGTAIQTMEQLVKRLPAGIGYEWTGLSYEEQLSGGQAPALYAISLIVVFLCLTALYESWSIPAVVMLVVPLGVVGAVLATTLRGLNNDVFFQVGLLTTVGLSAKNAILIVEFAKENFDRGGWEAGIEFAEQIRAPVSLRTTLSFRECCRWQRGLSVRGCAVLISPLLSGLKFSDTTRILPATIFHTGPSCCRLRPTRTMQALRGSLKLVANCRSGVLLYLRKRWCGLEHPCGGGNCVGASEKRQWPSSHCLHR